MNIRLRAGLVASFVVLAVVISGCSGSTKAAAGAKSGAAIGAGIGLFLGALTGDADLAVRATAVGAATGAASGGYEGWRQDKDDERTREITDAIREANASGAQPDLTAETRAREELTRFLGVWQMEGWAQEPGEERINVSSKINANVEMNYFVEVAYIDFKAEGVDNQIWGSSTLGYETDSGYSVSTRLNTLPEPIRLDGGKFDAATRTFVWKESDFTLTVTFETPDRYRVETVYYQGGGYETVELYTLTRS